MPVLTFQTKNKILSLSKSMGRPMFITCLLRHFYSSPRDRLTVFYILTVCEVLLARFVDCYMTAKKCTKELSVRHNSHFITLSERIRLQEAMQTIFECLCPLKRVQVVFKVTVIHDGLHYHCSKLLICITVF